MNLRSLLTIFSTCAILSVQAQIATDRPDQTENSSTVAKGVLQIESGILLGYTDLDDGSSDVLRSILLPQNLFRYGIGERFELRFISQYELRGSHLTGSNIGGISDLQVGTKIQLLKNKTTPTEISFLSHLILPTGTDLISGEEFGSLSRFSISHPLSDEMSLGYNFGYNFFEGSDRGDFIYTLSLAVSINDRVIAYIEPFGQYTDFAVFEINFDAGFTYQPRPDTQLDISFGTGLHNSSMNYISIGCSYMMKGPDGLE